MHIAGIFFLALIICIALFLTIVDFSRKESAVGSLVSASGTLKIIPSKSGIVTNVFVKNGDFVKKGQPLIEISTDAITSTGSHVNTQMLINIDKQLEIISRERKANAALNNERLIFAKSKIINFESQKKELNNSIDIQKLQITNLQKSLDNFEVLRKERLVSEIQYREAESKLLASKQTLTSLSRELYNLNAQILNTRNEISQIQAQEIVSSATSETGALQVQDQRLAVEAEQALVLTAKTAGRITNIRAKVGEPIEARTSAAVIVPERATMNAEIWVSSSAVPYLKINTPVNIMYDAFPYQKFGLAKGFVSEIAQSPTSPDELPLDLESRESKYRVIVRLERQTMMAYGVETQLTPGLRLKSDLILDKRFFA